MTDIERELDKHRAELAELKEDLAGGTLDTVAARIWQAKIAIVESQIRDLEAMLMLPDTIIES